MGERARSRAQALCPSSCPHPPRRSPCERVSPSSWNASGRVVEAWLFVLVRAARADGPQDVAQCARAWRHRTAATAHHRFEFAESGQPLARITVQHQRVRHLPFGDAPVIARVVHHPRRFDRGYSRNPRARVHRWRCAARQGPVASRPGRCDSPAANNSNTSMRRIRISRMQGRHPHCGADPDTLEEFGGCHGRG